jgi:cytochrome c5
MARVQLYRNHNANDEQCASDNIAFSINTTLCYIVRVSQLSDTTIFELKERAKWSKDSAEKKTAIRELSTHGDRALPALGEILSVTAYDDIKAACMEAIKAIEGKEAGAQDQKKDQGGAGAKLADLPP